MNKTLFPIRLVFVLLCTAGGWLVCYTVREWDSYRLTAAAVGFCIGTLVVLVDVMLKGFSLRGLSALTFG
ncbi:MAG TPA: twitching motility protein PilT, partial [Opitutaceae bacterium]